MTTDRSQLDARPGSASGLSDVRTRPSVPPPGENLPALLPRAVGKYEVLERIGAGAMGVVYKCRQPGLDRPVAVKVLLAGPHSAPDQARRFEREARAAARLSHPNVVQVYDVGSDGELTYFVMEYVDGCALDHLIGMPALTIPNVVRLLVPIARALQAAHEQGIIHRDVKPSNILLHRSGQPKLVDFGLAKSPHDSQQLSNSGDLIGTPRYMSPEQVLAAPGDLDARTDVYSLGVVMYEMLTGRPPVDGPNILAIMRQLSDEEPRPVRDVNPDVPAEVAAICERAMARDRDARFATAGAFAEALQGYLVGKLLERLEPSGGDARDLLTAPPPLVLPGERPHFWTRRRAALTGLVLLAAALLGAVAARGTLGGAPSTPAATDPAEPPDDLPGLRARLVAQTRDQLGGALHLPETTTPRDFLKAQLEGLTAYLKRAPDDGEVRLLRARVWRRAGEHLAACDDLGHVLQHDPHNREALLERLLAQYELHVLYLDNLKEPALRPPALPSLRGDLEVLRKQGDAGQKAVAGLIEALARQDADEAARLVAALPTPRRGPPGVPDWSMLEADALFHAADKAFADEQATEEGEARQRKRRAREDLARRASQALRRGLDVDPNHVGLLFLKANAFHRRPAWEAGENDDAAALLRRQKPAFETACDRLRRTTLRAGCDAPLARAVLLTNFGRDERALEQVQEALSCHPVLPYLYTLRAWLQLQTPPDGLLESDEAERIARGLDPAFETPPDDWNSYFARAVVQAAGGHWDNARHDLRECRQRLGSGDLPASAGVYNDWLVRAGASTTEFLYTTRDLLDNYAVPVELRLGLCEELLRRLGDPITASQEKLNGDQVRDMKGWTHYHLAQAFAQKNDRAGVLRELRAALQLRVPGLTPDACKGDGNFSQWEGDKELVALYAEFAPK
jgi:tetratricopeptide (TPR) repeat protein/predicted Ser/Thr protein kinase